jgi:hypothetical protein
MVVDRARYSGTQIRALYNSEKYPINRKSA